MTFPRLSKTAKVWKDDRSCVKDVTGREIVQCGAVVILFMRMRSSLIRRDLGLVSSGALRIKYICGLVSQSSPVTGQSLSSLSVPVVSLGCGKSLITFWSPCSTWAATDA